MSLVVALRAAWSWCRRHAVAILAGLAALGGLVAYAIGRRSTKDDTRRATDVGRAEGHADVLDEQTTTHTARADAARDEQRDLERAQDAAESAAMRKARDVERMSPDEKAALGAALIAARKRRQEERGR
ncbi:MAG: hypothetical protein IT374_26230 [Polyangiaceae bacterium]|nr:hypothetical protein [Polyangiaceae bacterium]